MNTKSPPRIAVFTHDAYGLGHIRRSVHILRGLAEREPDAALLLVTGSPGVQMLRSLPPNADYVKVPTVVTSGAQGALPPLLPLGLAELSFLRRRLIRETLLTFAPDIFLVDNFPLGSRMELLPTLQELKRGGTRIALGLRDIADPPKSVRKSWARDGIYNVLDRYYDRILVYGVPEVLDVADAYALPPAVAAKFRYCGYVTGPNGAARGREEARAELGLDGPFVLATVGGGGDGFPLLSTVVQALPLVPELSALLVTGEFMASEDRAGLRNLAGQWPGVQVRDFVPDLPSYFSAADVVVAMGGYNTTAEILATGCRAVLVPRTWRSGEHSTRARARPDAEQWIRAQALADLGYVDMLHPEDLNPEALAARIAAARLASRPGSNGAVTVRGLDSVVDELLALAGGETE